MPFCTVTDPAAGERPVTYPLICFDKAGVERTDDEGGALSNEVIAGLAGKNSGVTDIFVLAHGWKNDVPSAAAQYEKWIRAMLSCPSDIARARTERPGFTPLIVGLHWPSEPWGDERLPSANTAYDAEPITRGQFIESYADRIADTAAARDALAAIFDAVASGANSLSKALTEAYKTLDAESGMGSGNLGGTPDEDREPFDPEFVYQSAQSAPPSAELTFGLPGADLLLEPLRILSFWKMKDRARLFGERGASVLLTNLQRAVAGRDVRFHAMGHSFGCIAVSAMLAGPQGSPPPVPIHSVMLAQGAMSLWSFCDDILFASPVVPGYFCPRVRKAVSGPIVATTSRFDRAVGWYYPLAAGAARQVSYAAQELPRYGAIGEYGVQGAGIDVVSIDMGTAASDYHFKPGCFYNLNGDAYINHDQGWSGAHSDIAHPEVAHAMWEAALAPGD